MATAQLAFVEDARQGLCAPGRGLVEQVHLQLLSSLLLAGVLIAVTCVAVLIPATSRERLSFAGTAKEPAHSTVVLTVLRSGHTKDDGHSAKRTEWPQGPVLCCG